MPSETIPLPAPATTGGPALAEAIATRRSIREFAPTPVTRAQLGQLCWAAHGITDAAEGLRAAPSAGAVYPMDLYVVDADGVFEHLPRKHALRRVRTGDVRAELRAAAGDQACVGDAPVCLAITMGVERMARKYDEWAERYCIMEAGHIAQNVMLQAVALGLGSVPVAAFEEERAAGILELPADREPVYLVPLGVPADG
jgi:SagB-type dehydrogenase family enzyme